MKDAYKYHEDMISDYRFESYLRERNEMLNDLGDRCRYDFEEDMRYVVAGEIRDAINYAVKNGHMEEDTAVDLLSDQIEAERWYFKGEV